MSVGLYMDHHVPGALTQQLRLRGVDVLTAHEDGCSTFPDDQLLERARTLGRVLFTHDIRFKAEAENWQRTGRPFAGLAFGPQQGVGIGRYLKDLELIAKVSDPADWANHVEHLPFRARCFIPVATQQIPLPVAAWMTYSDPVRRFSQRVSSTCSLNEGVGS